MTSCPYRHTFRPQNLCVFSYARKFCYIIMFAFIALPAIIIIIIFISLPCVYAHYIAFCIFYIMSYWVMGNYIVLYMYHIGPYYVGVYYNVFCKHMLYCPFHAFITLSPVFFFFSLAFSLFINMLIIYQSSAWLMEGKGLFCLTTLCIWSKDNTAILKGIKIKKRWRRT